MAKSNASGLLTSLDSLFTTQEQRDAAKRDVVLDLPLDQIGDFPNHPFKVRQDDAMMEIEFEGYGAKEFLKAFSAMEFVEE